MSKNNSDQYYNPLMEGIQNELKDLNKNLKANNRTSDRLSKVVVILATTQVIIGVFQVFFAGYSNGINQWLSAGSIILMITIIYSLLRWSDKDFIK